MRVTLAYPLTTDDGVKHAPDETVSVSKQLGRDLLRDGRARPAEPKHAAPDAADPAIETHHGAFEGPSEKEETDEQER